MRQTVPATDEPAQLRYENLVDRLESLPTPEAVLTATDWGALEHAYGAAEDTPAMLIALLDAGQRVRSKALDHIDYAVHHQNTLYSATIPAALYVAGILADPRSNVPVETKPHSFPGPLRANLLGWLDSVTNEASDETEAMGRQHGFARGDYPPVIGIRRIRPLLFPAVSACADDPDPHVREAAIAACIPLLDDPRLLHHRSASVPLLRETLAASSLWQYRDRAVEALAAWGEDTSGLEARREPFEACESGSDSASEWGAEPGFAQDDTSGPPF